MQKKKGVENFKRRTWDSAEYETLALEREDRERNRAVLKNGKTDASKDATTEDDFVVESNFATLHYADPVAPGPVGSSKAFLNTSKRILNLDAKVGQFEKVEGARQAGFHCPVCDLYFQDSLSLLDHVNGREHQSRLGFSMMAQKATSEQVKSKLNTYMQVEAAKVLQSSLSATSTSLPESFDERVLRLEREAAEEDAQSKKHAKRRSNKKSKLNKQPEEEEEEGILFPELGFASFKS